MRFSTNAIFGCVLLFCLGQFLFLESAKATPLDDSLSKSVSWQPITSELLRQHFAQWIEISKPTGITVKQLDQFLAVEFPARSGDLLDLVFQGLLMARPDLGAIRDRLRKQRVTNQPPDFSQWIENQKEDPFLRNHVRLYLARWLAQNEF